MANTNPVAASATSTAEYDAIIIGSGFGGLYALHHLRDEMGLSVRAFDGAGGVGGTWWYNRYPGARVDAPSAPFYAFTFSKELVDEWEWAETQSAGPDVLAYLEHFAERFDLLKDIQFETWVADARYDEAAQHWTIETDQGEYASARFLICAVGALFVAHKPDYPGIDDFAGECYHTGRWPHEPVSFAGKRVGVIGTGSSGIQSIPEIAKEAAHVTVFQRTPQYSLPARNRPLTTEERARYREDWANLRESMNRRGGWPFKTSRLKASDHTPEERHARYEELWQEGGIHLAINSFVGVLVDEELNDEVSEFVRGKIRAIVRDPETARKLMPDYYFGTKRLILDNGYFETYNRDNVTLVDLREDPIEAFTPSSVCTKLGEHPIDMLVLATGFDAVSGSMLQLNPKGRGGVSLKEKWAHPLRHLPRHDYRGLPEPVHDPRARISGGALHDAARRRATDGLDRVLHPSPRRRWTRGHGTDRGGRGGLGSRDQRASGSYALSPHRLLVHRRQHPGQATAVPRPPARLAVLRSADRRRGGWVRGFRLREAALT